MHSPRNGGQSRAQPSRHHTIEHRRREGPGHDRNASRCSVVVDAPRSCGPQGHGADAAPAAEPRLETHTIKALHAAPMATACSRISAAGARTPTQRSMPRQGRPPNVRGVFRSVVSSSHLISRCSRVALGFDHDNDASAGVPCGVRHHPCRPKHVPQCYPNPFVEHRGG